MADISELPAVYGTRTELLARLGDCLAFARRTVDGANPGHPVWKVDLGQVSGFEKMMMEAGLLAYIVGRTGYCEEAVWALARTIREKYDSSSAVSCILRHPRLAASLGALLLVLERFGLATQQERAAVHGALQSPYLECSEHVPFRLLDRHWVLGLTDNAAGPLAEALQLSAACRKTHPVYMTRADGYAITHSVMYATDFGAHAAPTVLRSDSLWDTIDASVAWCLAAADFDLLTELLLAQLLLRQRLSVYGAIAWRRSRQTWDSLGFLPSPSLSATSFRSLKDEAEQRQYAFHNMYHTVLVGGLLCVAFLDMRVDIPDVPSCDLRYHEPTSVARAVEGAVGHLERVLGVSPSIAREAIAAVEWTADGTCLDEMVRTWAKDTSSPAVVLRMAIDASIILGAQDYDLPRLAAALRRAASTKTVTPTVVAGADFLARQSLVNGAIGAGWLGHSATGVGGEDLSSARVTAVLANCLVDLGAQLSRNPEVLYG
jgi:hypothetical protein